MQDFDERLTVPLWWWPVAAFVALLLGAEVHLGLGWLVAVITYLVLGAFVTSLFLAQTLRVSVAGGELRAGRARLPLRHVGAVRVLDAAATRQRRGPGADPTAYVAARSWVGPSVEVVVDDPADPTPYWLISTRRPDQLAAALLAGSQAARHDR